MLTYSLLYETYLLLIPIHLYYNIFIDIKHITLNKQRGRKLSEYMPFFWIYFCQVKIYENFKALGFYWKKTAF